MLHLSKAQRTSNQEPVLQKALRYPKKSEEDVSEETSQSVSMAQLDGIVMNFDSGHNCRIGARASWQYRKDLSTWAQRRYQRVNGAKRGPSREK